MIHFPEIQADIQPVYTKNDVELSVLREDLLHPEISGNKYRKLKYNLYAFQDGNFDSLLTFGGAYSNHIYAVAAAGKAFGIKTTGIIRGGELYSKIDENPTLSFARDCGMEFKFISREQYRLKDSSAFLTELKTEFPSAYILPEGGTNALAVKGCEEILGAHTTGFDYICCAMGTGGTISGVINSAAGHQTVLGFPGLKNGGFLEDEIKKYIHRTNYKLITAFHFGGFGKINSELIDFINNFKQNFGLTLDPVYTAKMAKGIDVLIENNYFTKNSKILMIHTGGIQGIAGMNQILKQKNKKLIK